MSALSLYDAPSVDYGAAEHEMARYREAGTARALALDNRGPLQPRRGRRARPGDPGVLLAARLLHFRGRAECRRACGHRARPCRPSGTCASVSGRGNGQAWPTCFRLRQKRPGHRLGKAIVGPGWRHRLRLWPPSGEDAGAGGAGRRSIPCAATHPWLAAIFRGMPAPLRPSRASEGGRGRQRKRFHTVQRGDLDQASAPRRFRRLAPGRLDTLGQPGTGRGQPRLQFHGAALRMRRGERPLGGSRIAPRREGGHKGDGGGRRFGPTAGGRAARSARRAMWRS